jgi:uncharacterized protein (UPF0332 family)
MDFSSMERAGLIERVTVDNYEVDQLLKVLRRDAKTAERLINVDLDWAFAVAYNSMIQGCLALMKAHGYRARGANRHIVAVRFAREALGEEWRKTLNRLDRIRKKRHRVVYEVAGLISEYEAKETIELASRFIEDLEQEIAALR